MNDKYCRDCIHFKIWRTGSESGLHGICELKDLHKWGSNKACIKNFKQRDKACVEPKRGKKLNINNVWW